MDKLKMETMDITQENVEKIRNLFPSAVSEVIGEDGKVKLAIDFDVLKQELSNSIINDRQERYQMTWPDKKKAILLANSKVNATLRPDRVKSKNFDNTQNLYIEGDNLDVLKLLRETYLGMVDVIYIDPPYNTGSDFVYEDDFSINSNDYLQKSGQYDEQGNRLVKNFDSNGRFHTKWLNSIYPRLKVARDLLSKNGVIFISIDDNELYNLKKICDEVFGSDNFIANFIRKTSYGEKTAKPNINKHHDYFLCYAKVMKNVQDLDVINGEDKLFENYSNPDNDPNGDWTKDSLLIKIDNGRYGYARYPITNPYLNITHYPPVYFDENNRKQWHYVEATFKEMEKRGQVVYYKDKKDYTGEYSFYIKKYKKDIGKQSSNVSTLFSIENEFSNANGTTDLAELFDKSEFINSYPKPVNLIKKIVKYSTSNKKDALVLDFFSGSGTTAQAVMQLNAEDGGNRKFILVQLPELCEEKSTYKTICELGEERIRRAGAKIKKEHPEETNLDVGFRVLKLDSSNMQDVYYNPKAMQQSLLDATVDNIKEDRTPEDLLFQVMISLGIDLSSQIAVNTVAGKTYYTVNENDIIACFDDNLTNEVITEIAKLQPVYAIFKDKSFATDSVGINNEQLFKTYSPNTTIKVL